VVRYGSLIRVHGAGGVGEVLRRNNHPPGIVTLNGQFIHVLKQFGDHVRNVTAIIV
jgi:hypothetical protein